MRKLIYGGVLLLTLLIQSTLMVQFQPFGIIPDLLLIIVISGALLRGSLFGIQLGLVAGILQDLLIGNFGISLIVKVLIGYLVGNIEGKVFKEHMLVPILVIFSMTFVHEFAFLLLSEQLLFTVSPIWALQTKILPLALVNTFLLVPIYPILVRIERKIQYH